MSPGEQARWRRIREIFDEASEAHSSARNALVLERCAGDDTLLDDVQDLLSLRKKSGLALDQPPAVSDEHRQLAVEAGRAAVAAVQVALRYEPGSLIAGRYRTVAFLARGGMGEVYEAIDARTSQAVALKFVRPLPANHDPLTARFLREVRMARKVEHPNVCRILDLGEHGGEYFCAMELLRGETLAAKLAREGRLAPSAALPIALDLCAGLAAAHRAGVLHRDLKPGNVFLEAGRAVIIDFGLAAAAGRNNAVDSAVHTSLTSTGAVIGTFAYMAPEQLEGGGGGTSADLYSLGVTLYEMLTGSKPHDARSPFRLAAQKARESHQSPGEAGIGRLPLVWREVITRSLKARPEDRFSSAEAMERVLRSGRPTARFALTRPGVLVPILVLSAALLGSVAWQWGQRDHVPVPAAARLYKEAFEAMTTSSPGRAVKLLERAIDLDAAFVNARSLLAVAHSETDQIDKAQDALLQAIAAKDRRWILGRAERLSLAAANAAVVRNFNGAAQLYEQLATVEGQRGFALLSRARMLDQAGHGDQAIGTLQKELAIAPGAASSPAARIKLAALLCRKREYAKAAHQFRIAEQIYQKTGNQEGLCDLWTSRAVALQSQGAAADHADLQRAIDLSARTGNRYQNLTAKLRMVAVAERERDYDRAIAVAGEVSAEAEREGMLGMAAAATAELGYAYVYARKPQVAAPILRRSVELAQRARSYHALASNRMKLGEVLGALRQFEEAIAVMEPAVRWHRSAGVESSLPVTLIKWGTLLDATNRFEESAPIFREAHDLAKQNGEQLSQSMALQRLLGLFAERDLRKAAEYAEQSLVLARRTLHTAVYFRAAGAWSRLGEFGKAERLIDEGRREAIGRYRPGPDQQMLLDVALEARALWHYQRGHCDEALAEMNRVKGKMSMIGGWERLRGCGSSATGSLRPDLAALEKQIAASPDAYALANLSRTAAELALRLHDWPTARENALRGIEATVPLRLRVLELENKLILRAAEFHLGRGHEVAHLTTEIVDLAKVIGFEGANPFGGRRDLLFLWKLGGIPPPTQSRTGGARHEKP